MEQAEFLWKSGELLTKQRLDDFTNYLQIYSSLLHGYETGAYGFGNCDKIKIEVVKQDNNSVVSVSLAIMHIIFPDGYFTILNKETLLSRDYQVNHLLCLSRSIDAPEKLALSYFSNQKEAYDGGSLPLAFLSPEFNSHDMYLKPVLDIKSDNDYAQQIIKISESIAACEKSIKTYFLEDSILKTDDMGIIRNLIFQTYLIELLSIKTTLSVSKTKMNSRMLPLNIGSVIFFSIFKKILIITSSFETYFNQLQRLEGSFQGFTDRETKFWGQLNKLLAEIDFIYFHKNIISLTEWMEGLSNIIQNFSTLKQKSSPEPLAKTPTIVNPGIDEKWT